jgi:tetratricopeptide (TPR) repeat protein
MDKQTFESKDDSQMRAVGEVHGDAYLGDIHHGQRPSRVSGVGGNPLDIENYWVDRAGYQAQLIDRLARSNVIEIVAAGGFGKSSLAAWAYEHRQEDFQRRVWVDFQRQHSFHSFAEHVLQEIDKPNHDPKATEATLLQDLLVRLRDANVPVKTLVVMDQLEAIADASDWQWFEHFLTQWAIDGKSSRVLVTTRSPILSQDPIALGGMDIAEGTVFFERSGLTGDRFAELIDLAGGHPLLLKLAASWTKETYGARVDDRAIDFFGKLFEHYQDDPTTGVEAIFGVIFEELPIGLQDLLCGVSVYRLPFGEAMAQAIGPEASIEDLDLLCDRGLLLRQGEGWTLHPLVADLVRSRVTEDRRQEAHEGAIGYYSENVKEWDGRIESCQSELEGFYHACALDDYWLAGWIIDSRHEELSYSGEWRILLPIYEKLTAELEADSGDKANDLAICWWRLGVIYHHLSNYLSALTAGEKALEIFERLKYKEQKANVLIHIGNVYIACNSPQKSLEYYSQAFNIHQEIDDKDAMVLSLGSLGLAYESLGDYQQAINYFIQSLEISQANGNQNSTGGTLCNIGNMYYSAREYEKAIPFYNRALLIQREVGNQGYFILNSVLRKSKPKPARRCA